jgi:hypothetical protein
VVLEVIRELVVALPLVGPARSVRRAVSEALLAGLRQVVQPPQVAQGQVVQPRQAVLAQVVRLRQVAQGQVVQPHQAVLAREVVAQGKAVARPNSSAASR